MSANDAERSKGGIVHPKGESRRRFLKYLGISGGGLAGLKNAIKNVYGKEPDGVPLVHTRDRDGNPKQVRYISKERYRRLNLLENINRSTFHASNYINGITAESLSDDEDDLAIKLYVDENSPQIRRKFPNQLKGVPITVEERVVEEITLDCSRDGASVSVLEGNVAITGDLGGTLGFVGRDAVDDSTVLITASHVMRSDGTNYDMYQPDSLGDLVGTYADHSTFSSSGYDICKYDYEPSLQYNYDTTKESSQPDISGTWNYTGLQDYLDLYGSLACSLAGQKTCYAEANCVSVAKDSYLKHVADMDGDYAVGGDSGGPWVDSNGNLVCTHTGNASGQDFGPVAENALGAIDAKL